LQLIENPHNNTAFLRVVNFPKRGIGIRALERLQNIAKEHNISLYSAIPKMTGKSLTMLRVFFKLIEEGCSKAKHLPLPEIVMSVLDMSSLIKYYQGEKEGTDRIENLEQLVNAATLFLAEENLEASTPATLIPKYQPKNVISLSNSKASPQIVENDSLPLTEIMSPLSAFLSYASLESGNGQEINGKDALQLMTVHSAKGLEFDTVFITGLEEGLFPHENSKNEDAGMEEERRLMYVAITRAKVRLYMSFSQNRMLHGQVRHNVRSRFFNELPEDSLEWSLPKSQQYTQLSNEFSNNKYVPKNTVHKIGWYIGENVFHLKFGEGVIINIEGTSINARARINFVKYGVKLLDLNVAKLEKVH